MAVVPRFRWTRADYEKLIRLGILEDGDQIELVNGELVQMTAHLPPHALAIERGQYLLGLAFGHGYRIRVQLPLSLDDASEPEPDIAVVAGSPLDAVAEHPATALLVVEVADTTLRLDRRAKGPVYARAQIPDYWIVNLGDRVLELRREPVPDASSPTDWRYASETILRPGERVAPLGRPDGWIAVADLFPPPRVRRRRPAGGSTNGR